MYNRSGRDAIELITLCVHTNYMKADCVVRVQQLDVGAAVIQGFQNFANSYICISSDFAETFLPVSRAQEDGMLGRALCS